MGACVTLEAMFAWEEHAQVSILLTQMLFTSEGSTPGCFVYRAYQSPKQLMRPDIDQNVSCAVDDFIYHSLGNFHVKKIRVKKICVDNFSQFVRSSKFFYIKCFICVLNFRG